MLCGAVDFECLVVFCVSGSSFIQVNLELIKKASMVFSFKERKSELFNKQTNNKFNILFPSFALLDPSSHPSILADQ
jgi:hypothetical protein